jgi:DMSO/TMAO reductase YedYZ molybdopterin-dependent catalytic subunit
MLDSRTGREAVIALCAGLAGVAGSYLLAGSTRAFVVAPIDVLVVNLTPGAIVAWMIENVGTEAHLIHLAISGLVATVLLAAAARAGIRLARSPGPPVAGVLFAGLLAWGATWGITRAPTLSLGAAVPVAVVAGLAVLPRATASHDPSRRRVLVAGAAALSALGVAGLLGRGLGGGSGGGDGEAPIDEEVMALRREADELSLSVATDDMPGLVTEIGDFYHTDIASFDPQIAAEDWSLTITGEVGEDVTVTYDELTAMPTEHRHVTLRCVGESLNGRKLDSAVWTGTPIRTLLEEAAPDSECNCVMLRADDGYFVQFPLAALADGFLAWGMNGEPLPRSHGAPVRALVPGHWGETNVKWLEQIELLDEAVDGYWEQRGWHGTGPVETVAKLWSVADLDDGRVEVAGHAYAGTRGIDRVEVSTDGGETWTDATLSEPLPGEDVWRQWRHRFERDGTHDVVVRATDGEGRLQPREERDSFPSGATGWVTQSV